VKLNANLLQLSPGVIGIFAVVSTIAVPLALATPESSGEDFLLQIVIGLAITTISIIALFPLLLMKSIPTDYQVPAWFFSLVLIGAGRGYLLTSAAKLFDFIDPAPLEIRIINSIVTTVLWITISAIFIELAHKFKFEYQRQISGLFLKEVAAEAELSKDFSLLTSRTEQLQQTLEDLQAANHDNLTATSQYHHLVEQVRNQVNEVLRPLSHRLYSSDALVAPRIRLFWAIKISVTQLSFSLPVVLILFMLTGFINGLAIFGFVISLLRLALVTTVWLIIHLIWRRSKQGNQLFRNFSYLFAVGLLPIMISESINDLLNFDYNYSTALLLSPLLPTLIVLISLINFFQEERQEIIKLLRNVYDQKAFSVDRIGSNRKQLASYLHNSLQSELVGISMQLDAASSAADEAAAKQAMERLHSTLTRSIQTGFQQSLDSPADRLAQVANSWIGIADLSLELPEFNTLDLADQANLVQLCEELISNSVRLGAATRIELIGSSDPISYKLTLISNGNFNADSAVGLGSRWIAEITDGEWEIAATTHGVRASAILKLRT
jgi:signal transduction histidine kinase